ncbi:ARM repeat-containing protein [Aureobasidium pullulans]|nr:ARM repeat-containing protein [Aureobasidium pullulans]
MATDQNAPPPVADSTLQLDIAKLHALPSEQQDLYLLTFSSDLSRYAVSLDEDGASAQQVWIKKELLQIVNLPSPAPTRVIRNNLASTFAYLFTKGNRKLLYESINDLVAVLNAGKEKPLRAKHAAVHCLGAIFEAAGDSAISLSSLTCTSVLRILKSASTHAGLRAAVYKALGRVARGIGSSIDETVAKESWKSARNAASSDKALLVQMNACWCLEQLATYTSYYDNSNDFDKLQAALWKAMDSPSVSVRHAASTCMAAILVKSFSEAPVRDVLPPKKSKKSKKQGAADDGEDELERPTTPVSSKPITSLAFSLLDIMRQLSTQYSKPAISNRSRAAIAICYKQILTALGESVVERQYGVIAKHLFTELLSHQSLTYHRYRTLMTRKFVRIILQDVVGGMLGETSQLNAARFLMNDIIKDYPQVIKERPEPGKLTLTAALSALTSLIDRLDAAVSIISESCRESLLQVLQHPSYTVQVHASRCMRSFVLACPQQLLPTVTICMNSVNREIGLLTGPRQSPRRCAGYANGLAAVLSASNKHPLYGSVDVYARVLTQATGLLKSSSNSDLRVSSTQVQVAWIMIGGLMSLGPNFVKIHLSQLLLLWKNALAPPNKENMARQSQLELSFLAHVRECALGSVKAFLHYNIKLLTSDVSRRLASMLQNTGTFLAILPERKTSEDMSQRLSPALQLVDFDLMVRRRVFQCYTALVTASPAAASEIATQSNVLPLAVASFADPDRLGPSSLSVSIASSAGTLDSIWGVGDNSGFGVNGLINGLDYVPLPFEKQGESEDHWSTRHSFEALIDRTILSPIGGAWEHDSTTSYVAPEQPQFYDQPQPPATEVVNSAIGIFALAFPLQSPRIQDSILEQVNSFLTSSTVQKSVAQKAALSANIALALLVTCKVLTGQVRGLDGKLQSANAEKNMQNLLHAFVADPDESVRHVAAQALGRLCEVGGNDLTSREINYLIETIVSNTEPHVRSGCALALACIHNSLGGMAASFHLKTILGIFMSLCADPHPLVHFWALESLKRIVDSAGLTFSGYVSSTIGLLGQLYVLDTHNAETGPLASSNLEVDLETTAATVCCVDAIINVMGPDLSEMAKPRGMVLTLIRQFQTESDVLVLVESTRCLGNLSMYAPGHMEFEKYVKRLQIDLDSPSPEIRDMAIGGLANLMRRDAEDIVRTANPGLEDKLWDVLDQNPAQETIKEIFVNWLSQTGLSDTAGWIQRCNAVLTKAKARVDTASQVEAAAKKAAATDLQDEEVAGFAAGAGTKDEDASAPTSSQELMRWQVRLFGMNLLNSLLDTVVKESAVNEDIPALASLQQRISDVVRVAFSASTANVVGLRILGLHIIDQVLRLFGGVPDPDFTEAMLLEQYQAQISSALTPAFAVDSSPELAAEAINVCATFVSTGIVTDIDRMGRILKILVAALETFAGSTETSSVGELKGLSPNAQVMVRMSVFSAWAGLQIATAEQKYLVDVVKPHVAKLTPLWLSSLREYSRLRFEPDISNNTSATPLSDDLETVYAALNRETLLKFYQDSWLNLVDAIASLIDEDSEFVFDALDGKTEADSNGATTVSRGSDINYREEPVAFFFVLFGLAFEALASKPGADSATARAQKLEILQALKRILRPSISGNAIYQEVIFNETMDLFDRMILTEPSNVQTVIVEIARNLCVGHPSSRQGMSADDHLSDDIDQLFELTRIIVLVLASIVPGLAESPRPVRAEISDEAVTLARLSLDALVDASEVFPSIIRADLHACIFQIFVTIMSTGACQATLVPQALPIFRRFISGVGTEPSDDTKKQIRSTLSRFLVILKNAQKREFEASLPCEKNTILAGTMLITSANTAFEANDPVLLRFVTELTECLDNPMTTKMAAGCVRTLLVVPIRGAAHPAILSRLLPRLVTFLTAPSDLEGIEQSRTIIAQSLTTALSSLPTEKKLAGFALLIPTLLARAQKETSDAVQKETAARLLELASNDANAFRGVVTRLNADQKTFMERVIKGSQGPRQEVREEVEEKEPTIALKMNF